MYQIDDISRLRNHVLRVADTLAILHGQLLQLSDGLDRAMPLLHETVDRPGAGRLSRPVALQAREREILQLLAAGMTNREIGRELHLATGTVKNRVASILAKLRVSDRTQAAVRALELGLLDPHLPATQDPPADDAR